MFQWQHLPDDQRMVLESETERSDGLILQLNTAVKLPTEEYIMCLSLWNKWHAHGILPYDGGWYEQPARVIDVIDLFDSIYAKHTDKE